MEEKIAGRAAIASMGGYQVVRADPAEDRPTILDLLSRNEPGAPRPGDQLLWHLERGPYGKGRAWLLLKVPESKPIGVISAVPRRLLIAGEVRPAARMWTMAVEKEHRILGPGMMLLKAAVADLQADVDFVWAMPHNLNATNLLTRAGLKKMAKLDRRIRVLHSDDYLRRMVQPVAPKLSSLVVPLVAPIADFMAGLVVDRNRPKAPDLEAICVGGFDNRFDDLWARAKGHYQFTSERTADFLGWRFRRSWDTYLTVGFQEKSSRRLVGYAVVSVDDQAPVLYDFFLEDPATLTAPSLMLLVGWLQARGFRSLTAMYAGSPELEQIFADRWFVHRKLAAPEPAPGSKRRPAGSSLTDGNEFAVMGAISTKRPVSLPDASSWHWTLADDI